MTRPALQVVVSIRSTGRDHPVLFLRAEISALPEPDDQVAVLSLLRRYRGANLAKCRPGRDERAASEELREDLRAETLALADHLSQLPGGDGLPIVAKLRRLAG